MHTYSMTGSDSLKGEAITELGGLADWFNVSDRLWKKMNAAENYWLIYRQDDMYIVSRGTVQDCVEEVREDNLKYTEKEEVQRRDVIMVIVGDKRKENSNGVS